MDEMDVKKYPNPEELVDYFNRILIPDEVQEVLPLEKVILMLGLEVLEDELACEEAARREAAADACKMVFARIDDSYYICTVVFIAYAARVLVTDIASGAIEKLYNNPDTFYKEGEESPFSPIYTRVNMEGMGEALGEAMLADPYFRQVSLDAAADDLPGILRETAGGEGDFAYVVIKEGAPRYVIAAYSNDILDTIIEERHPYFKEKFGSMAEEFQELVDGYGGMDAFEEALDRGEVEGFVNLGEYMHKLEEMTEVAEEEEGEGEDEEVIPDMETLIATLSKGSDEERKSAARLLGEIGDADALPYLADAVRCEDEGEDDMEIHWVNLAIIKAMMAIGEPSVPYLVRLHKHSDYDVRCLSCWAAGKIGDDAAVDSLVEALDTDPSAMVRRDAALALGRIGDARTAASLAERLRDCEEAEEVRFYAAIGLGKVKAAEFLGALLNALSDDSERVRAGAAEGLGKLGDPAAVDALIEALTDDDSEVRGQAVYALGKIGDPGAAWALEAIMEEEDEYEEVKERAERALEKIEGS